MNPSQDPDNYSSAEPLDEQPSSHKRIFVTVTVSIGLVVLSVIIAILFTWPGVQEMPRQAADPETRAARTGYTNIPDNVGDPSALVQREAPEPVVYQEMNVVDACSLLPVSLIREHNLLIDPGVEPGAMSRHFFDGSSEAVEEDWQTAESLPQELNDCSYVLTDGQGSRTGSLYISVYQPAYAGGLALRRALDDYLQRITGIGDVEVYDRTNTPIRDTRTFYFLQKDAVYANLEISLGEQGAGTTLQALLKAVAERLNSAVNNPAGPAVYGYQSPTFSGDYVSACAISDAADVQTVFEVPASPSLQERLATATGITELGGGTSNYIANQCVRRTVGERSTGSTLTVETRSFETFKPAEAYIESKRTQATLEVPVEAQVGDEIFFNPASGGAEPTLFFTSGATVISLSIYQPGEETLTPEEHIERLAEAAAAILERLNTSVR